MELTPSVSLLLAVEGTVPLAARRVCEIWKDLTNAVAVRLWIYNPRFKEFDLLAQTTAASFERLFQLQNNQLPHTSLAGKALVEKMPVLAPMALKENELCRSDGAMELFTTLPALICVPVVRFADGGQVLGVIDLHYQRLPKLNSADLQFLGGVTESVLSKSQSANRRNAVTKLNDTALNLVAPDAKTGFYERKEEFFESLKRLILDSLNANCLSIFVANESLDAIRCCATTGLQKLKQFSKAVYHKGDGATWEVFEQNVVLNTNNIQKHLAYRGRCAEARTIPPTTERDPFLAVPIKAQSGKIAIGVVRVLERRCHVFPTRLQNFSDYDVDTLSIVAAQISPLFRLLVLQEHRERFISRTAHQVIQPLMGIIGYASNFIDGKYPYVDMSDIALTRLRYIQSMATTCARMMRDAFWIAGEKDFSALRSLPRVSTNLTSFVLERIIDLQPMRQHEGIQIQLKNEAESDQLGRFMRDDDIFFDQVVQNVLHNAVKYSYPRTTVNVSVRKNKDLLFIDVASVGLPIAFAERERIFLDRERGSLAEHYNPNGTGQGLYICRRIMRSLGGDVRLFPGEINQAVLPPEGYPAAQMNTFQIELQDAFK